MWRSVFQSERRQRLRRSGTNADDETRRPLAVAQGFRPEDDAHPNRTERETASHAAHLLRRQSATGRSDEGATGRDDRAQSEGHSRLVPEQAMQGQEAVDTAEADPAAPPGDCKYHRVIYTSTPYTG